MKFEGKNALVTGGASFIGSHLVDALVAKGADRIRIVDDLSSGELENIQDHIDAGRLEFVRHAGRARLAGEQTVDAGLRAVAQVAL